MRRKNTPQEAKKSREKRARKSQVRKQRANSVQQSFTGRTVSAHSLPALMRHRFPAPGE